MKQDIIFTFGTKILGVVLGSICSIILVRFLGAEGKGVLGVITTIGGILIILGDPGISFANVYFTTREKIRTLVWNSLFFGLVIGALVIGLIKVLTMSAPSIFQGVNVPILILYAFSIPFILIACYLGGIIRGIKENKMYNIFWLMSVILTAVAYLTFLAAYRTVEMAIYIGIGLNIILCAAYVFYLAGKVSFGKPALDLKVFGKMLSFGIKGHIGNILQFFNYRLDVLIVNWFRGPVQVGYYLVAVGVAEVLWHLSSSVAFVLFPYVSACRDDNHGALITARYARITLYLTLLGGLFLMVVSPYLIPIIFGADFHNSVTPFLLLLPGIVGFTFTTVIASYLAGVGLPHYNAFVSGASFIITIVLDLILIPRYGINGAAIASTMSYLVATTVILYLYTRHTGILLRSVITPKIDDLKSLLELFKEFKFKI